MLARGCVSLCKVGEILNSILFNNLYQGLSRSAKKLKLELLLIFQTLWIFIFHFSGLAHPQVTSTTVQNVLNALLGKMLFSLLPYFPLILKTLHGPSFNYYLYVTPTSQKHYHHHHPQNEKHKKPQSHKTFPPTKSDFGFKAKMSWEMHCAEDKLAQKY